MLQSILYSPAIVATSGWSALHERTALLEGLAYFGLFQHFIEQGRQAREHQFEVGLGKAQGRREAEDVVAKGAEHQTVSVSRLEDPVVQFQLGGETRLATLVGHQFKRAQKAA